MMTTTHSPHRISSNVKRLVLTILGVQCLFIDPAAAQAAPASVSNLRANDPYRYAGLLSFFSDGAEYIGSGVVVKPYSVLTAGHNLYSQGSGWSTDIIFRRSYDYGTYASESTVSQLFILGGYAGYVDRGKSDTNGGFSRDMGAVVCFSRPANGLHAAWKKDTTLLTGKNYNMSLGYGAEVNSGEELLRSAPTKSFFKVATSLYENRSYGIEGGMSGGPVFSKSGRKWYVCAVNVSGPGKNVFNRGAGVRAIDADSAKMIQTKLR
jgi:V8-like Glu-specific endopeptidase